MEEMSAVTQVPMFCPMMIGMAVLNGTTPVSASACRIPTEADEDWMMAVTASPIRVPSTGLLNISRMDVKRLSSARGATASDIVSIPNIRMANPIRIIPILCFFSFLENMRKQMPISARTGENEEGLSRLIHTAFPLTPVRESSQEVTVVPMLAPMITPTACSSFMIPELTKPTTMTVVADEDWMTAVTARPRRTPEKRVEVSFSSSCSMRPPESIVSPSPMAFMP